MWLNQKSCKCATSSTSAGAWNDGLGIAIPKALAHLPELLLVVVMVHATWIAGVSPAIAAERPNVVVFLSDDQGWGDLSLNGNKNLRTPAIDSIGLDGAQFDRFYVCPVCSPTRAEFLTGRYHPRGNIWNVSTGGERLDLDERTIADVFQAAGYATACFGKWHNGTQYPYHPLGRGFEEYYGFCSGHWGDYFDAPLEHNGKLVRGKGFLSNDLTDHAISYIEQQRDKPFFVYVPYNTPHSPMQVPDEDYARLKNAELPNRGIDPAKEDVGFTRAALAMCENLDRNVARVLKKLDELHLRENTIVVYFCDNGPVGGRWNGGMKGRKATTDEGGVRSPLLIRWPGKIAAGTQVKQIASVIDLMPTLADLTGIPTTGTKPLDGISLRPWLIDKRDSIEDRQLFSHWANKVSVRTARFRLDAQGQLYDMLADPGQKTNVAAAHPAVAKELSDAVAEWKNTVLKELERVDRPFTVGYKEFPVTHLPARDGVPHGNVKRSARAPNCSYFTNWITKEDTITWDIDVATAGRYQVVLYYTCPSANLGAKFELRGGTRSLTATVTEAHDPPAYGAEHDRSPRDSESLVKEFKPWTLGEMTLEPGLTKLTLQATEIPGPGVIEVRGMTLTLLDGDTR